MSDEKKECEHEIEILPGSRPFFTEREYEEFRNAFISEVAPKQEEWRNLRAKAISLPDTTSAYESRIQSLEKQLDTAIIEADSLRTENAELREKVNALETVTEALRGDNRRLEGWQKEAETLARELQSAEQRATEEKEKGLVARDRASTSEAALVKCVEALEEIKFTCLTEQSAVRACQHIIRLCIDAGVTKKLDELTAAQAAKGEKHGND